MKRAFDLIIAAVMLIFSALPIFLILCLIKLKLGTPVFFSQVRPGLYARPFKMFKFRTMTDARDANGELLSDSDRLTRFGKLLRSSSLDELPGLWNVLKGDMSLVGPRPLLMQYLDRYTPEQARRHKVRPGITGWAQVNGRNAISWEDKFFLDVWYVDHQSIWLDIKILCLTVFKVIRRSDISATGNATMPEFMGSATTKGGAMGNKPIDIVIFGTGGHAREMHDLVLAINKQEPVFNFIGFLDQSNNSQIYGAEQILGNHTWLCDNPSVRVVIAIGSSVSRSRVSKLIRSVCKNEFQTLIHPTAYIGQHSKIGTGSMIAAGAVLTCNVSLGEHTIVNVGASLSHEVMVEDFVTIAPSVTLCGAVSVAEGSDIGAGATVIQQRKIGAWSIIGAGAVVINDVSDNVTVVGNPARVIVERKTGWQDD